MRCCSWVGNIFDRVNDRVFSWRLSQGTPVIKKKTSHGLVMGLQTLYSMALLGISWGILWGYHQHELGSSHCGSNGPCIFEGPIAYGQRTKSFKHSVTVWPCKIHLIVGLCGSSMKYSPFSNWPYRVPVNSFHVQMAQCGNVAETQTASSSWAMSGDVRGTDPHRRFRDKNTVVY